MTVVMFKAYIPTTPAAGNWLGTATTAPAVFEGRWCKVKRMEHN
jgi:hypothetical protein